METDIGEVLLPTESWDVTAYLPEDREQRNHNVTLILQYSMLFSLLTKNLSRFYLPNCIGIIVLARIQDGVFEIRLKIYI